ncbi:hypothetical protein SNE40_003198 [Patella caerulea]|uniref:EF-hand domain-containing protein n=1 Tax=Patella caerulea TaxID=87958 RepID=A0AAN8KDR2_PATCE
MDFVLRGNPTPRSDQRHLLGSTVRPNSGKTSSRRNPITGEVIPDPDAFQSPKPQQQTYNKRPYSKPKDVPGLDLKYLKEENEKKVPVNLYEYSIDTPNTASTISWGSSRSLHPIASHRDTKRCVQQSERPRGVPSLSLAEKSKPPSAAPKPKPHNRPTAWDRPAVPEDTCSLPSAHYQEMYENYSDEMKLAYKNKSKLIDEGDVNRKIQEVKKTHPLPEKVVPVIEPLQSADNDGSSSSLQDNWTKLQYSKSQILKKTDAENMADQYKKQKLVETVMIDQLSRAVISDPEQDQRTGSRTYGRVRGSNRYLHESKISTRSTATENLLSKRVRFGARILTRNGHDAMRELTGFFFSVDNTLTIYEFKQFGKSAKAMPFINRGMYHYLKGPLKDEPITLTDIYSGGTLLILTSGHQTLPKSLSTQPYIAIRVTDVDEKEKAELLLHGEKLTDREAVYADLNARKKEEHEIRIVIENIQDTVQTMIKKRGVKTITGLGRHYRDLDRDDTGWLDQNTLERGLQNFHIQLDQQSLNFLFEILDPDGNGGLDYSDFMRGVLGEMNEYRKTLVRKAFQKLDAGKKGIIDLSDIKKFFNMNSTTTPHCGETSAIQAFLSSVRTSPKQEEVSYTEFEEYYEGISVGLDSDEDFTNVLRNTWNI